MSKLHFCLNGTSVTDQVIIYQKSRLSDDFKPVMKYYDDYRDVWFAQLEDYMDRAIFDSEFEFRLFKAVDSFDSDAAQQISSDRGLDFMGNFNRWFYKILMNWKSNVKTSSFRLKKRPPVYCPVCGRQVGRIDKDHLQHYKSVSDLPKFMTWKGSIYEVFSNPRQYAVTWGKKTRQKLFDLRNGSIKIYESEKRKVRWPWRLSDGRRGVLCPFVKKIIPKIDDIYLLSLSDKHNRYAPIIRWEEFVSTYPSALIQSEILSTDSSLDSNEDNILRDQISGNERISRSISTDADILENKSPPQEFEHAFRSIDKCVKNDIDAKILKLVAAGYSVDDICETLKMDKKDVKIRIRSVRQSVDLQQMLVS